MYLDERHKSFFDGMGLHEPNVVDYVKLDFLAKYENEEIDDVEVLSDFDQLYKIWRNSGDEQKESLKEELSGRYKIKTVNDELCICNMVFEDNDVTRGFYGDKKDFRFVDCCFYERSNLHLEIEKINSFFCEIGIQRGLIIKAKYDNDVPKHIKYGFASSGIIAKSSLPYTSDWKDLYIWGYSSEISKLQSHAMWRFLVKLFQEGDFDQKTMASCKGYGYRQRRADTIKNDGSILYNLRNDSWIYDEDGKRYRPSGITMKKFVELGYEYELDLLKKIKFLIDFDEEKTDSEDSSSLEKLGATEEQQRNEKLGRKFTEMGGTEEDIDDFFAWKKEKEKKEEERLLIERKNGASRHNPENAEKVDIDDVDEFLENMNYGKKPSEDEVEEKNTVIDNKKQEPKTIDLDKFIEQRDEKIETEQKKKNALDKMNSSKEYTKEWFLAGLHYEYLNSSDTGKDKIEHSVSISFTKVEPENDNVYRFSGGSKLIPRWLEEVDGDIKMTFEFRSGLEKTINFAMASVQDFALRLRAYGNDESVLKKTNWQDMTKATLDVNNPKGLVKNLYEAFKQLPYGGDYDMKEHLRENVNIVFGPPGTGKTYYLANEIIIPHIKRANKCRILVLTPTNQACDVIAKDLLSKCDNALDWLGRFVATNDEFLEESGIVWGRDSNMYLQNKCCLISTIARLSYDFFEKEDGTKNYIKDIPWDILICDEGSMISLPEIVYAIYKLSYDNYHFRNIPIYIAGDPKQLQPIDASDVWNKRNIYEMIELNSFKNPETSPKLNVKLLDTQWRSVPAIGELYSHYAYDKMLNHGRNDLENIVLNITNLPLKAITYMPFKVDNFDDIYGAKRINGSNVHIYSAIIVSELCRYIAKEYKKNKDGGKFKIGIICPYAAQAYLIDKLISGYLDLPLNEEVEIVVGTIHSFQGDQCNVIFALFNPPKGMASKRQDQFEMLVNDEHLVNVAISRARDYLCLLLPSAESYGWQNLKAVNHVGQLIAKNDFPFKSEVAVIQCNQIEKLLFGKENFLKDNTYITSHQMANVYSAKNYTYDIRIDENAIDIQTDNC